MTEPPCPEPDAPVSRLEEEEYRFLTTDLLVDPPHVPLEEAAIEVEYAKLVPEAKGMFEWAHVFHRQTYDVWADESITEAEKDATIEELIAYYKSRPDLAFSSIPKSMELMDGQYYSTAFRKKYPKFNGLIWAYHWLQVGLYEPLVTGDNSDDRQTGVTATVARFWQVLENAPANMPRLMPMTAAVAPTFAARYPEAAIIFDNLHMMHDVVSDILVSPEVPRDRKREEILRAAAWFRDATSFAMTEEEWIEMVQMMGVANMGGRAAGGDGTILTAMPQGTVPRGMSMAGMDHGNMPGMEGMAGDDAPAMDHGNMENDAQDPEAKAVQGKEGDATRKMQELHRKMMADPVIRQRVMDDPALHGMMMEVMQDMPGEHDEAMMHEEPAAGERPRPDHAGHKP